MLLAALEGLAADEAFTPKRTTILALGVDEESAGTQGALELSRFLEQRYGR
jgi:Gly-Xaa carboxypeptidase